jgi:hypothetical protein
VKLNATLRKSLNATNVGIVTHRASLEHPCSGGKISTSLYLYYSSQHLKDLHFCNNSFPVMVNTKDPLMSLSLAFIILLLLWNFTCVYLCSLCACKELVGDRWLSSAIFYAHESYYQGNISSPYKGMLKFKTSREIDLYRKNIARHLKKSRNQIYRAWYLVNI